MRTLLRSMCESLAFETVEAEDGKVALEQALKNQPIDIALVDWDMPVMNGMELIKELRTDEAFRDTMNMMITAHNSMDDVIEAMELGADDFLMKPLTEEMFVDKMRVLGLTS